MLHSNARCLWIDAPDRTIVATRAPLASGHLFTFDDVNLADLTGGLALTSREHLDSTLKVADASVRRLAAEGPGQAVVLWERGLTSWRKIAYYAPALPVFVLEHKQLRSGSPAVVAQWKGGRLEARSGPRVLLPPGARVIRVTQQPVTYTDLPDGAGERTAGEWTLAW